MVEREQVTYLYLVAFLDQALPPQHIYFLVVGVGLKPTKHLAEGFFPLWILAVQDLSHPGT